MSLLTKLSLISEILRSVSNGHNSIDKITDVLSERPNVFGSDVSSLIPLVRKFNFIAGEDGDLKVTEQGLAFMNYLQGSFEETAKVVSPTDSDLLHDEYGNEMYPSVGTAFNETIKKYEGNEEVLGDLQKLYEKISVQFDVSQQVGSDDVLLLTASIPPGMGEKIPQELRGAVIHHNDAVKKVVQDTSRELLVSSPYMDIGTLKMLIGNLNASRKTCKIITSDKQRLFDWGQLDKFKNFLNRHFLQYEIRLVKKEDSISHAKAWISEKSVHITSANILENSQTDNFELGIYSTQRALVKSARILFEKVWKNGDKI